MTQNMQKIKFIRNQHKSKILKSRIKQKKLNQTLKRESVGNLLDVFGGRYEGRPDGCGLHPISFRSRQLHPLEFCYLLTIQPNEDRDDGTKTHSTKTLTIESHGSSKIPNLYDNPTS